MASAPTPVSYALPPFASTLAAAEAGDEVAQYNVAVAFASGTGVAHSWPSAFAWNKRSAAHPYLPIGIWVHLGRSYEHGRGVAVPVEEAVRLYRVGAAVGDAGARRALAQCLLHGVGVPTPDRGAFALFTALAVQAGAATMA